MESALAAGMFRSLRQQQPPQLQKSESQPPKARPEPPPLPPPPLPPDLSLVMMLERTAEAPQAPVILPAPQSNEENSLGDSDIFDEDDSYSDEEVKEDTPSRPPPPPPLLPPFPLALPLPPARPKMSAKFYNCLLAGNLESLDAIELQKPVSQDEESSLEEFGPWFDEVTPQQNTALHIVARQGFDKQIRVILNRGTAGRLKKQNMNEELALHLAAGAGHLAAVDAIMAFVQEPDRESVCETKNKYGETPLHVAVRNKHISVARSLVKYHPKASFCLDETGDSPLSLAAESGELELVKDMINENRGQATQEEVQSALENGKSVVHAAILGGNSGVLEGILEEYKFMINSTARIMNEGFISPLSCAAYIGNVKMVKYILEKFPNDCRAYRMGYTGSYPIHIASGAGHKLVIEEFLRFGPDLIELLTSNGQNILHVSASRGKYDVVSYILNKPDSDELINARDNKGNRPLHLAAAAGYPKVVDALTWDNRVRLDFENADGKSAVDMALEFGYSGYSFKKQLTWLALKYAGAPRKATAHTHTATSQGEAAGDSSKTTTYVERAAADTRTATYKDRVNALSVVAALVITVTFTAGFVIPGGHNGSDPDLGMTSFPKRIVFRVFVISNSIALYTSVLDLLVLIFSMLGDVKVAQVSLNTTVTLLTASLVAMSISFISALYLVVSTIWWLGILVWVMGSVFIAVLLALFFLFTPPILPKNRFTRYLAYPAFKTMLYMSEL